jgi:pyridoxal phosphate enzyme (YggS family)
MNILLNYKKILSRMQSISYKTNLIVVCKNQELKNIDPLISAGHSHFGENRVQEALSKWQFLLQHNSHLNLHLIGKLQTNKAREAFKIFNYIHTLDNEKLANSLAKIESSCEKKVRYFVQVNIGNETQKSGIEINKTNDFIKYCIYDLKLNVIGLMCIPPAKSDPSQYFINLANLAKVNNLNELSMGMSNDYESAINNGATFVRVGSKIFSRD